MRFAPLTYRIELFSGRSTHLVTGYAVELPAPFRGLRFCVRESAIHRGWNVDHYDSGHGFGGPIAAVGASAEQLEECRRWAFDRTSRARCAQSLLAYLRHAYVTGTLRPLFERHGYGWCIDEAEDAMASHSARDRARIANVARRRGHAVDHRITKVHDNRRTAR